MPTVKPLIRPSLPALPAMQGRSRATRDRLLDAAEALLARGEVDAATVPAIASRAGVAVGSVYRRFPDKDALLRAVYERFFTRGLAANKADLAPERWQRIGAGERVSRLVRGMVEGYRVHRPLLKALLRYGETHGDPAFRRRAEQLRNEAFARIAALLPVRSGDVAFALTVVRLVLQGLLREEGGARRIDDDALIADLTRLLAGYLGVD